MDYCERLWLKYGWPLIGIPFSVFITIPFLIFGGLVEDGKVLSLGSDASFLDALIWGFFIALVGGAIWIVTFFYTTLVGCFWVFLGWIYVVIWPGLFVLAYNYWTIQLPAERAYRLGKQQSLPAGLLAKRIADAVEVGRAWTEAPEAWRSRIMERRVRAFAKHVQAEEELMTAVIDNLKTQARFEERGDG